MVRFAGIHNFLAVPLLRFVYLCSVKICLQIAFVFIILAGSIGIPVYEHTCLEKNQTATTLFVSASNCHEQEEAAHEKMPCCKEKKVAETATSGSNAKEKHDCCNDEVSAFKVGFYKLQHDDFQFTLCALPVQPKWILQEVALVPETQDVLCFADLPPPRLQDRLALLQVWRI